MITGLLQFLCHMSTTPSGNAYSLSLLSVYPLCVVIGRPSGTCGSPRVVSQWCAGGDQIVCRTAVPEDGVDAIDMRTAIGRSTVNSAGRIDLDVSPLSTSPHDSLRKPLSPPLEHFRFRSDVTALSVMTSPALLAILSYLSSATTYSLILSDNMNNAIQFVANIVHALDSLYKKLSYCWETVRRESMPRIAEMDVEMTT